MVFCFQNCSVRILFVNSRPSVLNFKSLSRSPEQFIKTVKGKNNFRNRMFFLTCSWRSDLIPTVKCFTYVTKTIANLTTYSRKLGDYNGTIIFEIDIMKNSSPLNLKFTFFATVKTKITLLFCWTHSTLSSASE